jgi:glycosyltransferase involved in cell wall biosynthesis
VPPDNAAAFASGLARMVDDRRLREEIGASGLQYVTQKHSRERLLSDIRALYSELMHQPVDKVQFANGHPQLDRKEMMN